MHKLITFSTLLVASGVCLADDVGRVISTTPVVQQVGTPRKVCSTEQVAVQQQKSGAGAVMGAVAGGAIGNQAGRGAGNAAATMLGIVGGAILGDQIEGSPPAQIQDVQHCSTQVFYENRTVAYNVVYEFGGKQYTVQMPQDPGPTIRLQITPIGAASQNSTVADSVGSVEHAQAPTTMVLVPAAPLYYEPPPVRVGVGWGDWDHRRWR